MHWPVRASVQLLMPCGHDGKNGVFQFGGAQKESHHIAGGVYPSARLLDAGISGGGYPLDDGLGVAVAVSPLSRRLVSTAGGVVQAEG